MEAKLEILVARLETATVKLESMAKGGSGVAATTEVNGAASVTAFDTVIFGTLKPFLDYSNTIGGAVKEQAALFQKGLEETKNLVSIASQSKKPADSAMQSLIKPLNDAIGKITALKDANRTSPFYSNLCMVADGSPALGWVIVTPTPSPYVKEMKDAANFYANRVVKENKDKNQVHLDWVKAFMAVMDELVGYVKQYHTTGLYWNPKGGEAAAAKPAATTATALTPTQSVTAAASAAPAKPVVDINAELGKGTSGLKKVDKSQMTHKNPELRGTSVVKATDKPIAKVANMGPAICELQGNKWVVENQVNCEVVIDKAELRHVVYVYNCQGATIKITGKVNALTMDKCKKTAVVVDNIVSTMDAVNCTRIQIQITGMCPTAVVDKTDGYQLYLSKESSNLEFFSAKSSEINILVQKDDGEFTEMPVPEQFKTVIKNGALITVPVEHKE